MIDKFLWKFRWDLAREGIVEGLFVATEKEIADALGKNVYFGEILGNHSEIYGEIEDGEIIKVETPTDWVSYGLTALGPTWCGYNPLEYLCGDECE